ISSDRIIQTIAQLCEGGDVGREIAQRGKAHAQCVATQRDILVSRRFEIKSGSQIDQCVGTAAHTYLAADRLVDAGQYPQQRRLSAAVKTDQADAVAFVEHKGKVM